MLILSCSSKLRLLEGILRKNLPQTLPVHGAIMNINRGNPAGHEVIVDSWPEFKAVLTRPHREIALDDSDVYANMYAAFYRDLDVYRTLLQSKDVVNWAQNFRIHGIREGILEVSKDISAAKQVKLSSAPFFCYLHTNPYKAPDHRLDPGFKLASLKSTDVDMLNETWNYGGSEQSRRYLATLIGYFPSTCILDANGVLISWNTMDPFGAIGHSYTLPAHRGKGYIAVGSKALAIKAYEAGYPVYGNVALDNIPMQKVQDHMGCQKVSDLYYVCNHYTKEGSIKIFP
ncbi:glycine N-acyltransferase-like protein 3 isoform X2 [Hemicordylus capensis]|nr:glycine N-acyltransferase-like protein 3 isoform X2 [Hemicordylus capensis]XP_053143290.1 glycine N-acyltransferase-like protein 3 isoform X2 [Hemicordylus capensis]